MGVCYTGTFCHGSKDFISGRPSWTAHTRGVLCQQQHRHLLPECIRSMLTATHTPRQPASRVQPRSLPQAPVSEAQRQLCSRLRGNSSSGSCLAHQQRVGAGQPQDKL